MLKSKSELLELLVGNNPKGYTEDITVDGKNFDLNFELTEPISLFALNFSDCEVKISNFWYNGTLTFKNCKVTIQNSKITRDFGISDAIVEFFEQSTAQINDTEIFNSNVNCLSIKSSSKITLQNCKLYNARLTICSVDFNSTLNATKSIFQKSGTTSLWVENHSFLSLQECSVSLSSTFAVEMTNRSTGTINNSTFSSSKKGYLKAANLSNFIIYDSQFESGDELFAALFFVNSEAEIHRISIKNYLSNCIISTEGSSVEVNDSVFESSKYPSIVSFEKGKILLSNCKILNSISAAVARNFSYLKMKNCEIENCQDGIQISKNSSSELTEVSINSIGRGITVCDRGSAILDQVKVSSDQVSLEILTCSSIEVKNSYFSSKKDPIHARFGVSLNFNNVFAEGSGNIFQNIKSKKIKDFSFNSQKTKIKVQVLFSGKNKFAPPCIGCQEKLADGDFFLPCLHRPYCTRCFKKEQNCPLCNRETRQTLDKIIAEADDNCPVCLTNHVDGVIPSCKHSFCFSCIQNWNQNGGAGCMTCRNKDIFVPFPEYE